MRYFINAIVLFCCLLLPCVILSAKQTAICPAADPSYAANFLSALIHDRCIYVYKQPLTYTAGSQICKINSGLSLEIAKIEEQNMNDFARGLVEAFNISKAYIGLQSKAGSSSWTWDDGTPLGYGQPLMLSTPAPTHTPRPTVPTTVRTTAGPGNRRRSTSVVLVLDRSVYATVSDIENQLSFYRQMGQYITDRGNAEFAILPYGCDNNVDTDYVPNYQSLLTLINKTRDSTEDQCTRIKSFSPSGMSNIVESLMWDYYTPSDPTFYPQYNYISIIFISTVTDSTIVGNAPAITSVPNTQIITVAVGPKAASLRRFAVPVTNTIQINDFSNIPALVQKVDQLMFPANTVSLARMQGFLQVPDQCSIDVSQYDTTNRNTIIQASDGLWYPVSPNEEYPIICMGSSAIANPAPTDEWKNACPNGFTNTNDDLEPYCIKTSESKRNYAAAQSTCQDIQYQYPPQLISITSEGMQNWTHEVANTVANEGMFWIGLTFNMVDQRWIWQNGNLLEDGNASFSQWREGYPRDADGAFCVAYVITDDSWINTDCSKNLTAICAYRWSQNTNVQK